MNMKTKEKPQKRYRDMDNEEKHEYNQQCIWNVLIFGIPIIFLVRYLLLGFAVDHLNYEMLDVYPIYWCFRAIAAIIMTIWICYYIIRSPRVNCGSSFPGV